MIKLSVFSVIVILGFISNSNGHTYHTGQCPSVEPMSGFDMKQFLGIWYAVQKTSTASTCVIYNITRGEEPGEYKIEQTSQHFALGLTPLKHDYSYTGDLIVKDADVPAKLTVRFPLSVAGSSSFTIFMSDYNTFAGIFSCQKLTFAHRRSATILSRTRTLDKIYVDKIRSRLSSYSVDPFDLSIVSQSECPKETEDGVNIHIDPNTFSTSNIANVFRKAGEKLGDGFEYVVGAGKKAYNKLTDKDDDKNGKMMAPPSALPSAANVKDPDSEWVPF